MKPKVLNLLLFFGICWTVCGIAVKTAELTEVTRKSQEDQKSLSWVKNNLFPQTYENRIVITATTQNDALLVEPGYAVNLGCKFSTCPESTNPVTITWKRGQRLMSASRIASYTVSRTSHGSHYADFKVFDKQFAKRLVVTGTGDNDMKLKRFHEGDVGKYWCVVQTGEDAEYGMDAVSITLKSTTSSWDLDENSDRLLMSRGVESITAGNSITLQCRCRWCDGVAWLKGPTNEWANHFETIIEQKLMPGPTQYHTRLSGGRNGRISYNEEELTIDRVEAGDTGRYWCEVTWTNGGHQEARVWESRSVFLTVANGGNRSRT